MSWLFLVAFYFILIPAWSGVRLHSPLEHYPGPGEGHELSCSGQWPAPAPLSRPHLSKLQTVQRAMEQTSHYAIITSTTLNTLSTLIIGLHLECQVLFFKSDGCLLTEIEVEMRIDLISTFPFLILTNLSSSILSACLRHWPEAWVRPEPGAASPTNGREAALPAGGASASHSHERKSWGQAMVLQPWPSLCQLQTPETLRHATLIRAWSPHSVTSDDDDDAPGVRRLVTDRPLARPLSLQLSAAEITSAPRALCTAALQSLKLQSNGIFITRTWHSELDVWGKLLYSITYICHRRNPHQPEDKTQVKEVFSFFQCSYFRPEHSTVPADKSSFANVIVGMTSEGSHESVFCVPVQY